MKILLTGSNGLVGKALWASLSAQRHELYRLVRHQSGLAPSEAHWDPLAGKIDASVFDRIKPEAVIHLAGENIAAGRWTVQKKKKIRDSRVIGTRLLAEAMASSAFPPKIFISASAIGYYGSRGDETLTEASPAGQGFLAEVCQSWEDMTQAAVAKNIRVVRLRFGVILSKTGGAFPKLVLPFKLGVGGILGDGKQYVSWVSLEDAVSAIEYVLASPELEGPVNVVAPHPVTNREWTRLLGKALSRPTLFPLPAWAARLLLGEMAEALLLCSARVSPAKLLQNGFRFRHSEWGQALLSLVKK